jgi:hypothetical protein
MAAPIVITVAALTAGWVWLGRERATSIGPAPTPGAHPTQHFPSASEEHPGQVVVRDHDTGATSAPVNTGHDPATSPSHAPDAVAIGTTQTVSAPDATVQHSAGLSTLQLAFGVNQSQLNGLSNSQQAKVMADYGGPLGEVW